MKKLLLIVLCTLFIVSCSNKKTVVISGKVIGGSPLERIEIVEMSGVATLPIANFGVDAQGNFSDTIQIPKNGVYTLSYGGSYGTIYLKGGENVRLSGNSAAGFPKVFTVEGDSKNNVFLQKTQTYLDNYFSKINQDIITQDETKFIDQLKKFKSDLNKEMDNLVKSTGADSDLVKWKKDELDVNLLMISGQYEMMHGQITNKPNFKVSQTYKDFQKELKKNEDEKIKVYPSYRNYILSTIGQDFQAYMAKDQKAEVTTTEKFINFMKTKKDYSQTIKDYLTAFVATSVDMHPQQTSLDKLTKLLDENIKDSEVKAGLKKVEEAIYGLKIGTAAPSVDFIDVNGKKVSSSSFNGKPTLIMFYASWNSYIAESVVPMLKEISNTYKNKVNFVFADMDDNAAQFKKTAVAMLNGIEGQKLYAKGGLKSEMAQKYALYGFKLPSFVILDKDAKIASKNFMNIMDPDFKTALDKVSGITGPAIAPPQMQVQPAPAPADSTKVKTEAKAK
ncbi:TlpA family protein disulfide reductase [Elizabethkingia anophelis]|uniref:TlpA family protein disulfide reductase n=1 Tax=Elizabethkingia anophelis TaxID=1117645 RepID=UPI000442AD8A|nr:TlpA disulfide reductase family protein [Elizabethkingia anophelis]CDN74780.1 conserved exported hypothetical protein [Elizabethkingia anophelis]CDN77465.1 conserved exported hypothetical protein [Elizabethkingia anophelis]